MSWWMSRSFIWLSALPPRHLCFSIQARHWIPLLVVPPHKTPSLTLNETASQGEARTAASVSRAPARRAPQVAPARAVITYWFMALYCTAKAAAFAAALNAGATWGVAILNAWTDADQALWAGVLNFWFLGRVFDRVRS
jgi:hypothetical protein